MALHSYRDMELFAWIGEDELGSGEVGIKQGLCSAGCIPLTAKDEHKLNDPRFIEQLQEQANQFGKTIRLCRYRFVEELVVLTPKDS